MMGKNLGSIVLFSLVALSPLICWGAMCIILRTSSPVLIVASDSMSPYACKGDIVVLKGTGSPEVGSVIAFSSPRPEHDMVYIHRLIGVERQGDKVYLRTQGDAYGAADSWLVPSSNVLGSVVLKIPLVGSLGMLLGRFRLGLIAATALGYLFLVYSHLRARKSRRLPWSGIRV